MSKATLSKAGFLNTVEKINKQIDSKFKISKEKALALWNKEISPYGYPNHQKMLSRETLDMFAYNKNIIDGKYKGLKHAPTVGTGFGLDASDHSTYYITDELVDSLLNTDTPKDFGFINKSISLDILPVIDVVFSKDADSHYMRKVSILNLGDRLSIQTFVQNNNQEDDSYNRYEFVIPITNGDCCQLCETQKYFKEKHLDFYNYYHNIAIHVWNNSLDKEQIKLNEELIDWYIQSVIPQAYKFVINLLCLMTQQPDIISVQKPTSKYVSTTSRGFASQKMNNVPNVHWIGADFTTRVQYSNKINKDLSEVSRGKPKKSHWRRGHWHTILQGPKRLQRKLKWFQPVFIKGNKETALAEGN